MKILDEVFELYGYQLISQTTCIEIHRYLTMKYPEAKWEVDIVDITGKSGLRITPKFRTPLDRTMYLLKWA